MIPTEQWATLAICVIVLLLLIRERIEAQAGMRMLMDHIDDQDDLLVKAYKNNRGLVDLIHEVLAATGFQLHKLKENR